MTRRQRAALASFALALSGLTVLSLAPTAHAATAAIVGDVRINEVFADGAASSGVDSGYANDFIELTNLGTSDEDVTGWKLVDDKDTDAYVIGAGDTTVIPAGGTVSYAVDLSAHSGSFGLGKGGDAARLYAPDGSGGFTLVDQFWFTAAAGDGNDFQRCSIGNGQDEVVKVTGITKDAANSSCPSASTVLNAVKAQLKVNEVVPDNANGSDGKQLGDWIELDNTGATSVDLTGWWLSDDTATDKDVFPSGTVLKTGSYGQLSAFVVGGQKSSDTIAGVSYTWGKTKAGSDFGLGAGGDNAALIAPDGSDVDRVFWGTDTDSPRTPADVIAPATGGSIARSPDGTGAWQMTTTPTASTANSITGDDSGGDGGSTTPTVDPNWADVKINEISSDNAVTIATGVTIQDPVELYNTGSAAVDLTGWLQADSGGAAGALHWGTMYVNGSATPATTQSIPAHGYAVFQSTKGLGSGGDAVNLYLPDETPVDSITYAAANAGSDESCSTPDLQAYPCQYAAMARVPDGTGTFLKVTAATFGASNDADTGVTPDPVVASDVPCSTEAPSATAPGDEVSGALTWPGASTVATADSQCEWIGGGTGQDLSGLVFDPTDPTILWAVKNKSVVYKLHQDSTTHLWVKDTENDWSNGKDITFPGNTGLPDSEGLTVGPDGALYVTTERDNDASGVPLDTVLRFDPSAVGTTLVATDQWTLTSDLGYAADDSADSNLGFEGVTWVPDSYLTSNGFRTDAGVAYDPAHYAGKSTAGLFFAAVEKTGHLRAYALYPDHSFQRVADIATGMAGVMDVSYDAGLQRIWTQCDNTCGVDATLLGIGADGHFVPERHFARPAGLPDNNLEGFAVAPLSTAVNGQRAVLWSDDGNFGTSTTSVSQTSANGGHSLWEGSIDAVLGLGAQGYVPSTPSVPVTPPVSVPTLPGSGTGAHPAAVEHPISPASVPGWTPPASAPVASGAQFGFGGSPVASGTPVAPGTTVTITAGGFKPFEQGVAVVVYSTPIVLGHADADANGDVTWTGPLPQLESGQHTLTLQGTTNAGQAFTVADPVAPAASSSDSAVPDPQTSTTAAAAPVAQSGDSHTGLVWTLVLVGLVVVLGAAAALVVSRRRSASV